ncbi:MAG: hypothetical protein U5K37_01265 [Natrialbaceae archaeon]|nr:hypothetical protein [Natrialbaceae archaeon]
MPCPHSGHDSSISKYFRRDLFKTALASGGLVALAACIDEAGIVDIPTGGGPEETPNQQFAWNDYLARDPFGNTIFPIHQVILFFDYTGSIPPTPEHRAAVNKAFDTIDRAIQRGNGGGGAYLPGGDVMDGLLYTFGYSSHYFERFDGSRPDTLNFYSAEKLMEKTGERSPEADTHDAALVLTSDHAQLLLAVEMALQGKLETLNGREMAGTFEDIFELTEPTDSFRGPECNPQEN